MKTSSITIVLLLALVHSGGAAEFEVKVLNEQFFSEGATIADIDGDGHPDVVSGPFWYAGPDFEQRIRYMPGEAVSIKQYSPHFFTFADDLNNDGHPDLLVIPIPGAPAWWYQNPGGRTDGDSWKRHPVLDAVDNESPGMYDLTGDGKRELVCIHNGEFGYASPHTNAKAQNQPWQFTPISKGQGLGRFTHGLGVGDVNGDGRNDIFESRGWWEQPKTKGQLFQFHNYPFAQAGGSQMFAYDFDGDGDNDVVSVQNAHGWGLTWFEHRSTSENIGFIKHEILPAKETDDGLNLSQMHAVALADIDGDGIKDIITGKRFFAHGGNDPGAFRTPALYWFRTIREDGRVRFEPQLIHNRVGVGTQLTVRDINNDNRPDIVVGNKLGTFILHNVATTGTNTTQQKSIQQIGSSAFAKPVRDSEALTPDEELNSFVLPEGFDIQLVTSEPDIAKPLNMAFDAKGRLWVSSSLEYPFAATGDRQPRDSIRILEDTNGDGHRDKVTVFADGLNIPMGLYPSKDGVVCFSIPNIWHLRDTDGDDICDKREILYGPIGFERDTHGMCNAFTRGNDGWLYACHGFNNHTTVAGKDGHTITMQSGNTFRFRLDGSRIEHFTHGLVNPFGMAIDQHGDHFVADCHTKPVNLLLANGYYDSFGKPHDGLGYVPTVMDHLHGSTAIGGIAIGGDSSWPPEFRNNTFGGNVMTSRINRNSLHHNGSSPTAREEPDFLMSADPWFRPVDLQFGPDGALYVADFYNKIIGHYEVDLKHPGRDRTSGRIWRISYTGGNRRGDNSDRSQPAAATSHDLTQFTTEELLDQLKGSNPTRCNLIVNHIVDQSGQASVHALKKRLQQTQQSSEPSAANDTVHILRMLARVDHITDSDLRLAFTHNDPLVAEAAARIIGAMPVPPPSSKQLLIQMIGQQPENNPFVQRAAVMAMAQHPSVEFIQPLISTFRKTSPSDVQLRHAIRMTLRDHLQNDEWFSTVANRIEPEDIQLIAGICLALKTEGSAQFIVRHIDTIAEADSGQLPDYMRIAMRYASEQSFGPLANAARTNFADQPDMQLQLLQSARDGLQQRGSNIPKPIRDWALELADGLLGDPTMQPPLSWTYQPHSMAPNNDNLWTVTTRRDSVDGQKKSTLFSSIPKGEKRTGIYRSDEFELPNTFSFYMAGHDGFPKDKVGNKNGVRLRDAVTQQVIKTFPPPRNDTAHRYAWKRTSESTKRAYVELFDGDDATAYAWIAVGRFSNERLNPATGNSDRHTAANLAADFQLIELQPKLIATLQHTSSRSTESLFATALIRQSANPDSRPMAVAKIPTVTGADTQLRSDTKQFVTQHIRQTKSDSDKTATSLLIRAFKVATSLEQQELATELSTDRNGADELLALIESGNAAASLLQHPAISERIQAIDSGALKPKVKAMTADLPTVDAGLAKLIARYKSDIVNSQTGSQTDTGATGQAIFEKNCAICHQIAGKGKKVGPNLDGIAKRGLDRLLEDVLHPNRNVDINFRSTTIVTASGKVHSGLLRQSTGSQTTLVDSKGTEISIPTSDIEEKKTSRRSPMPANFHETLKPDQFRRLFEYLLSVN